MSEPSTERGGLRGRYSRWRSRARGRSTLKAAYAQAARDIKRMDPAVREQIGRANLTPTDLQRLATQHVAAQFRPGNFQGVSQRLGDVAADRIQASGPAPRQPRLSQTRNSVRRIARRYSRWGRNERRGTKALKAAFQLAARDVKNTNRDVQLAIGRSTLTSSDLAAMASGRMDEVFRPGGRFQGGPGQSGQVGQQAGAGMIQSRDAARQGPDQLTQRITALQESIAANQARMITLMEETNRLQAEMRQLLETRVQQIEQQIADLNQSITPERTAGQQNQLPGRPLDDNVRLDNPVIQTDNQPGRQTGEPNPQQPQQTGQQPQPDPGRTGPEPTGPEQTGPEPTGAQQPQPGAQQPRTGVQEPQQRAGEGQREGDGQGTGEGQRGEGQRGEGERGEGQRGEGERGEGQRPHTGDQLLNAHRLTYDGASPPPGATPRQQEGQPSVGTGEQSGRPQRGPHGPTRPSPTRDGR